MATDSHQTPIPEHSAKAMARRAAKGLGLGALIFLALCAAGFVVGPVTSDWDMKMWVLICGILSSWAALAYYYMANRAWRAEIRNGVLHAKVTRHIGLARAVPWWLVEDVAVPLEEIVRVRRRPCLLFAPDWGGPCPLWRITYRTDGSCREVYVVSTVPKEVARVILSL